MKTKQTQSKKTVRTGARDRKPISVRHKVTHHAKRVLIPRKDNEYRPHLIRAHGIIAVLVVAILAQALYSFATTGQVRILGQESNIKVVDLLTDTNDAREKEGLGILTLNDDLSRAAYLKAQDMYEAQYWAHVSPSGVQPWKWFADVNYNYSVAGENLAKNYPTAQATVDAWMDSETHRANILNKDYRDVGFAVVDGSLLGESTSLVVALYGSPVTLAAVQSSSDQSVGFSAPAVAAGSVTPLTYFGSALRSLSPVTIAILGLLAVVAIVGAVAHHYRSQLPKAWRRSWRVHHGMYTFVGMIALGVLIIIATGAGQI